MTLLNGLLAFGALAFTVPLAIHLLFRSRFRTVDWGAMHLLDNVIRVNRRRIELMHWLLLLLRCSVPVLLAFCLARPVLTDFQSLPGDAPQTLVLAIDDSRSMSARDTTGFSRMEQAKQGLAELLGGLTRRDEVMVVRSSRLGMPTAAEDVSRATRRLREIEPLHGPADLGSLTRSAIEAADTGSHPQRRVVVVGDFPSHAIEDAAMSSLSSLASTLDEKSIRPVISFWNLGVNSDQLSNVSVQSVEVDSPAVVARRNASFSATLYNSSDVPIRDLRVVWTIAGSELSPTLVSISPRSSFTSRIAHRIDEVGVHPVTVAIEHSDALMEDNRRSIAVDVIREIRVLLVDGQPGSEPLEGETDYLAVALSPYAFGGEDQPDAVRTSVIQTGQVEQQLAEGLPDVMVLANVETLSLQARRAIAQFVLQGGALVVFDGQQLDPNAYNEPWVCDQGSWTLPSKLGAIIELSAGDGEDSSAKPTQAVGSRNPLYSAWEVLGPADQQPFADVDVNRYRQLSIGESGSGSTPSGETPPLGSDASPSEPPLVLWSMSNGDPLAISANRGLGRVVQFAIPCDTQWSTLPLRMVYLPMMQQLFLELAGSRKNTTVNVGEGFSVAVSELSANLVDEAKIDEKQPPTFRLEPPASDEIAMEASNETPPQLTVTRTETPGVYRLRKTTPLVDAPAVVTSTMRIAEVPSIESQLRDADPARLAAAAKLVEANVFSDVAELQSDDRTRRFGREIWRWLLLALLVVLVAELWLQQQSIKSARRRAT